MADNDNTGTTPEIRVAPKRVDDAPVETGLPAPGHSRDEELLKRMDTLDEKAESLSNQLEITKVDSKNYEPDREILSHYKDGDLPVSNKDDNYVYCWVFRDPQNRLGGRQIMQKKVQTWEVVSGDMRESWENRDVNGYRIVGDVLLMRIRLDRYMKLIKEREEMVEKRSQGVTSTLDELAQKANRQGAGIRVHRYVDSAALKQEITSQAKQIAQKQTDEWIKSPKGMPGVPVPRG